MSDPLGAREAIRQLYETYGDDIYRYALFNLKEASDAHDIVQEVFFRAFRSWHTFRNEAQPRTWLLTIARNCIYDFFRKTQKEKEVLNRCEAFYGVDQSVSPDTLIVLDELVRGLKEKYRQVFVLRHINHIPIAEVARILGWSEGKVRTTDHRAIAMLREAYQQQEMEVNHNEIRTRTHEQI